MSGVYVMSLDGVQIDHRLEESWARVRGRLRAEVGEAAFRSWLKPLSLLTARDGLVRMAVPTRFMCDWVKSNYASRIRELWVEEDTALAGVEIVVQPPLRPQPKPGEPRLGDGKVADSRAVESNGRAPLAQAAADEARAPVRTAREEERRDISAPLDPRFTFDNFVVGKPNELAYAAARRVAESREVPFKPLFLYGGVGLGKTHLMHAIAWQIRKRQPERRLI